MTKYILKFFVIVASVIALPNAVSAQDMFAPPSAGATVIQGVNWGTVTSNNHSISFNGAHLIPGLPATGPRTFQIEYGTYNTVNSSGQPGGAQLVGYATGLVGNTVFTLSNPPTYEFNITINNLMPAMDFYFTIIEVHQGVYTNLLTYTYASTTPLGDVIQYEFPTDDSIRVYGNLVNSVGTPIATPMTITISDAQLMPLVMTEVVSNMNSITNGGGYFEHTFDYLSGSGINPSGGQYSIVLRRTAPYDNQLAQTAVFTVPEPGTPPEEEDEQNPGVPGTPAYTGLVPCGHSGLPDCDFDMLIVMINRVVDFLILFIGFPIAAVVIAWAGVLLLTSGGSTGAIEKAKTMFGHVVVGLILALLAWGIIKIILVTLGYQGPLLSIFGIS